MTETTLVPHRTLNDGTTLPELGLGTYQLRGTAGAESIAAGIRSGYRLLDTAYNYENEGAVGAGIVASGIPRDELRVTSKLPGRYHRHDQAVEAVEESLYRAGLDHFDLYLIHWPNPKQDTYVEAWQTLIELRERGLLRSIGVSNFLPEHLTRLTEETGVTPSVNQIEIHPWFPQDEDIAWNHEHGIAVEAWSPVGRNSQLQQDPVVTKIAEELGRSPVQVILRWHLTRGTIPLPKSADLTRQRENLALYDFELTQEQLGRIAALAREDGRLKGQDPAVYEEF
ncbi:aldo/keto reductase [Nesterenkonia xinjiangensis]|uniref:Diketogulonate reductase-like aldo/keto reductase n=1 Tax=Nesterenkonia xinjiangensis TaxID=225327 RepID=A0A7Z0GMF0_9MICC|nr:aldo/keto reductase [Nesterenkonia xinjiangensis]NYJ78674.1 diketogulonate reductase-like aldo/keto reductase [Nesterenkonia xinjiangensis]